MPVVEKDAISLFFLAAIKKIMKQCWGCKSILIKNLLQKLSDKQKQKCFQKEKGLERHPKVSKNLGYQQ